MLLTIMLQEDVDEKSDTFFEASIINGRVQYRSRKNRITQAVDGMGTPGDTVSFRTMLTRFIEKVEI